jgi:hypothetical protein
MHAQKVSNTASARTLLFFRTPSHPSSFFGYEKMKTLSAIHTSTSAVTTAVFRECEKLINGNVYEKFYLSGTVQ